MKGFASVPLFVAAMFLFGCAQAPNRNPEAQQVADRAHSYVMRYARDYVLTSGTKAMAACIRWPSDASEPIYIDTAGGFIVADQSDGQLPASDIVTGAMRHCQGRQAEGQFDCNCQLLDVGGSNRLEVPATITSPDHLIRSRRSRVPPKAPKVPEKPDNRERVCTNLDCDTDGKPVEAASGVYGPTRAGLNGDCPPITCENNELLD